MRYVLMVVALGFAGYLTRTWPAGEAAAVLVAVLVIALALIGAARGERVPVVEPDRSEIRARLKALDAKQQERELQNFLAITSVRRGDQ